MRLGFRENVRPGRVVPPSSPSSNLSSMYKFECMCDDLLKINGFCLFLGFLKLHIVMQFIISYSKLMA
ncbi:hypothetical protein L1987_41574 [Smallanthus sonchifolius]|uniref:Uncharacterized protein n=1 Tax=Smallanthus sonchifolius TaxID=185202 RepID=A0ACB9GVK7_9ASTR|nr:hypothetical protein L1987_41574 [Smallanthus sonchifolius]